MIMGAKSHQSCPILCDPMVLPGSSVHVRGILQARILEWVAVQESLRNLFQHHNSKVSILWCSYDPVLTILCDHWEDHSLEFRDLVMSLLFKTQSRFVIAFLPRKNCLLILWLQSPSAVILEPKKRKSVTTSTFLLLFAMQ